MLMLMLMLMLMFIFSMFMIMLANVGIGHLGGEYNDFWWPWKRLLGQSLLIFFCHPNSAFPHLLPPTVSAPWDSSTWTQGDQSVILGSLLQVLKTSGILFLSSKINHLFHFNWSAADPYWIIRTIFARMSMNDSETVALIGDYRL